MLPILLADANFEQRLQTTKQLLDEQGFHLNHPDLLWLEEEKLGVDQAKKIRSHLALKPFQAQQKAVAILHAENLTTDAQNALLKTLEEPLGEALIILGVNSVDDLLPTIQSRSQLRQTSQHTISEPDKKSLELAQKLVAASIEQRFALIEKATDRQQLFQALVWYFRQQLTTKNQPQQLEFYQDLMTAERWLAHNVTIRPVLEYLCLKMPV